MTSRFELPTPSSFGRTANGTAWSRFGAGEPIVLIHGVGMCQEYWAPQVNMLMADAEVITYDMWGHGRSTVDADANSLHDFSHQLDDLLTSLEVSSAHIAGHSLGALVAIQFAGDHPERVRSLVALNAVYQRTDDQRAPVLKRAHALRADGTMNIDLTLNRWFGEPGQHAHPEAEGLCRRLLESVDGSGYADAYLVFAEAHQSPADVGRIACPAVFATGEDDPNSTPDMSRGLATAVRGARAVVLPRQRHMMSLTAPNGVTELIAATARTAAK